MSATEPVVDVDSVSKVYGRRFSRERITALNDVSLRVERGEIFGLLGPNGAGKTTLVKILLGVVRLTSGEARLGGLPVADVRARQKVGFLPENHRFPDFLTASQLLDYYGAMANVPRAARRERIPSLLDRVKMTKWSETRIRKFSKGMMQRLGIAQALLNDPEIVFLDEPTDGVDPVGRREIRDILLWLREQGKTVFLNSHLLSEVEQVCTRVAILDEARVAQVGTVADFTTAGRSYRMVLSTPEPGAEQMISSLLGLPPDLVETIEGRVSCSLPSDGIAALNQAVDQLRSAGVLIHEISPGRRTLEDHFIQVVTEKRED